MERVRRLSQFWNWLPAFRAVAESEHLPTAAKELGISAPGLSRSIKLVEEALGRPLFERRARRLLLNESGQLFLRHVRDAMRRVDDGLQALARQTFAGRIKVAASNSASLVFVLPALERLAERYPDLSPELYTFDEQTVSEQILKGALDLALLEQAEAAPDLEVEQLANFTYGIYCGVGHALATAKSPTLDDCLQHAFVASAGGAQDAWPVNRRRQIGLRVNSLSLAMAACGAGRLLALLPDAVASLYPDRLRRLAVGTLAQHPIFIAHRRLLGESDRVTALAEALHGVAMASKGG